MEDKVSRPSTESLGERIGGVRKSIDMFPFRAGREVIALAREFAIDSRLRVEAVSLQPPSSHAADEAEIKAYRSKLNDLVNRIAAGLEKPSQAALDGFDKRTRVFETTRGRTIERRTVVRASGLTRVLKGQREFRLNHVSLDLKLGEITGVVGGNGAGKSTLFRLLVGEMATNEGKISFPEFGYDDDARVNWLDVKRHIAYVPQNLPRWFGSLEDNLRFAAASKGLTGPRNDEAFDFITNRLGLTNYLPHGWDKLSGGFQLRFALAQALIWNPRLLVLDEPLAHLDFRAQLMILNDVSNLARSFTNPIAVVISSQHLFEIEAVADDILYIDQGTVQYYDRVEKIGADRTANVFELGCPDGLSKLERTLSNKKVRRVFSDGLHFQVQTDPDYDGNELLFQLTSHGIDVTYFRDISRSVRHLFEKEADVSE